MPSKLEMEHDKFFQDLLRGLYRAVATLGNFMLEETAGGVNVAEVRIQSPTLTGEGYRIILKGNAGGTKYVAFHNAESLAELLQGVVAREQNGQLRWRADLPFEQRQAMRDVAAGRTPGA